MNEDAAEVNRPTKSPSPDMEREPKSDENGTTVDPLTSEDSGKEDESMNKVETTDAQGGDELYIISNGQRQAMRELDLRDGMGDYSEPPDYDVKERIQQLNSELEREPTPDEEEREHKVNFKDELIDLIAPPPEYTTDEDTESSSVHQSPRPISAPPQDDIREESEQVEESQEPEAAEPEDTETEVTDSETAETETAGQETADQEASEDEVTEETETRAPPTESTEAESEQITSESSESEAVEAKSDNEEEREEVLVERGGEFHVEFVESGNENAAIVNADTNESKDDSTEEVIEEAGHSGGTSSSSDTDSDDDLRRFRSSRPVSAPAPNSTVHSDSNARPVSAYHGYSDSPASGYLSPYGLSNSEKSQRQRRLDEKQKRLREAEERKKEEEAERKKNAEEAFNAWLRQKRDESVRRKQREQEEKEAEMQRMSSESSSDEHFKNWLSKKREQMRQERQLEMRERDDYRKGICIRSREDCEQAFKEWIRRKNREAAFERNAERQRARLTRLALRRSRKSQALARAIHQANAFRYVDYYGYRF